MGCNENTWRTAEDGQKAPRERKNNSNAGFLFFGKKYCYFFNFEYLCRVDVSEIFCPAPVGRQSFSPSSSNREKSKMKRGGKGKRKRRQTRGVVASKRCAHVRERNE